MGSEPVAGGRQQSQHLQGEEIDQAMLVIRMESGYLIFLYGRHRDPVKKEPSCGVVLKKTRTQRTPLGREQEL
jgi:hypothetical protein